ncbi:hypothetical protein IJM86_05660 [bacterium]|nr:hypothetical protein [bacterium]
MKNTKIFFSKNGTLPLENIYHVYLNGSELTNNNGNFELELGDVTSNSKFDIKVQLTGIIEADKTL